MTVAAAATIIAVEQIGTGRFKALAAIRIGSNVTVNCPGYGETEEDACEDARRTAQRKVSGEIGPL